MNIAIVGTGYVGLVSGACFAEMGANVTCVDVDEKKIERLRQGIVPIFEPQLEDLVQRNSKEGRLSFSSDLASLLDSVEIVFCAVGTPPDEDGSADLKYVLEVASTVGRNMNRYILFVTKSTVPVGTSKKVKAAIEAELGARGVQIPFDVASNPEFLKEGTAIKDFMSPDRVVVGVESERARKLLASLYRPMLLKSFRILFTDIASAEMIKYASNSMLATRISFMNDIANLCELVGADVNMVRQGIGADTRIGNQFLYPGCGYGGSCFPKDVKALVRSAEKEGYSMDVLKAVEAVNAKQKEVVFKKLSLHFGGRLEGRKVALWGLAFKPDTDDMREAVSLIAIESMLKAGCTVTVYDPAAMDECRRRIRDRVDYAADMYDALKGADALMIVTEWKQFRMPDWARMRSLMSHPFIIDGRNIYDPDEAARCGFAYTCIGRR